MIPDERSLVKRLKNKPFALLGINSDKDRDETCRRCKTEDMTWRSWFNGGTRGSISTAWGVHSWPTIYVLDGKGVIRYKDVRGEALEKAVKKLVAEQMRSGPTGK
jgi:hypothetical protein